MWEKFFNGEAGGKYIFVNKLIVLTDFLYALFIVQFTNYKI